MPIVQTEQALPSFETASDRLLSLKAYTRDKKEILANLRERGDDAPRLVLPGRGSINNWHENVRASIHETGGKAVRGFILYTIPLDLSAWKSVAWKATFHIVVETATSSGKTLYTDPNEAYKSSEQTDAYIFVPSARAHRELSDDEILQPNHLTGSVVYGNLRFCDGYIINQKARGRKWSIVGKTPETLLSKRNVRVRLMPHFSEWHRQNEIVEDAKTQAELMGSSVFEYGTTIDESDVLASYAAVTENEESYVDGLRGLKLELGCRQQLMNGTITLSDVRSLFFAYFDETLTTVTQRQAQFRSERLSAAGYNMLF
tara:strand:+ start:2688 stop:3635 length:948 start_codon:yes stop_codon:yes gene_type:complete